MKVDKTIFSQNTNRVDQKEKQSTLDIKFLFTEFPNEIFSNIFSYFSDIKDCCIRLTCHRFAQMPLFFFPLLVFDKKALNPEQLVISRAIKAGNLQVVKDIQQIPSLSSSLSAFNNFPIFWAIYHRRWDITEELLKNPNIDFFTGKFFFCQECSNIGYQYKDDYAYPHPKFDRVSAYCLALLRKEEDFLIKLLANKQLFTVTRLVEMFQDLLAREPYSSLKLTRVLEAIVVHPDFAPFLENAENGLFLCACIKGESSLVSYILQHRKIKLSITDFKKLLRSSQVDNLIELLKNKQLLSQLPPEELLDSLEDFLNSSEFEYLNNEPLEQVLLDLLETPDRLIELNVF